MQTSDYVVGLTGGNRSDDDRRDLRSAGLAGGLVEIDGRVWMARGGGQTLGGTPLTVERHCMMTSWFLSGYRPTKDALRAQLTAMAAERDVSDAAWSPHVDGDDYGFATGGLFVRYGSLVP
jgi:hypothetical protein